jgi:hypothetical protein
VSRDDISAQDGPQHCVRRKLENESSIHGKSSHSAAAHKGAYAQPAKNETPNVVRARQYEKKSFGVMPILLIRRVPTTLYTGQSQHCNSRKLSNPGGIGAQQSILSRTREAYSTKSSCSNYSFVVSMMTTMLARD